MKGSKTFYDTIVNICNLNWVSDFIDSTLQEMSIDEMSNLTTYQMRRI
jgi:hypothetical protein